MNTTNSFEYLSTSEAIIAALNTIDRENDFLPILYFIERTPELSLVSEEERSKVLDTFDLEVQSFLSEVDPEEKTLEQVSSLCEKIRKKEFGIYTACEILQECAKRFKTPGQKRVLIELCKITGPDRNIHHRKRLIGQLSSSLKEAA